MVEVSGSLWMFSNATYPPPALRGVILHLDVPTMRCDAMRCSWLERAQRRSVQYYNKTKGTIGMNMNARFTPLNLNVCL